MEKRDQPQIDDVYLSLKNGEINASLEQLKQKGDHERLITIVFKRCRKPNFLKKCFLDMDIFLE